MCHRNTTEEYAHYVLGEREDRREEEPEEETRRIDGEAARVARNADD
ncbi:hypothetical protein ACFPYI_13060 [Halomarina salina]|uniref:Uncharacterized protein n=1 Tax=Halomarina salina TaxID=1872699 RepID=A0ABD5RPS0_9EURY|nr:hypothetical protein [Halomarina salina]